MEKLNQKQSIVFITGAGPGDPDLLTLKAREIIEKSDVIAYDNLVSKEILELALFINPKAMLIYVGKVGGDHEKSINQEQINKLLLELSKEYKTICRLKGGDPNIFGRGGEEAIFLKENDINFEIIPGVSSISAVPAYAGIPLTHRDYNSSFTVISAHEDPFDSKSKIKWESFDAVNSTIVLLMGVRYLSKIIEKLISLGRRKDTPLAVIYWGTTNKQKTIITTLNNAEEDIKKHGLKAPSVIVIGEVVNYRDILNWFETKPFFGKRVLITRSTEQSFSFAAKLIKLGAKPIPCPIVNYKILEKEIYNKKLINNISTFDWIIFTSQNAVKYFFEILQKNCYDSRVLSDLQIAAVGYKTKIELTKFGINADFMPKKFSLDGLIEELVERENLKEKKILLPTQIGARHGVPLQGIIEWPIYQANFINKLNDEILNEIKNGIDILTFFSSNTARHFVKLVGAIHELPLIAAIGDETSKTCKELFGKVDIIADPYTEEGLITAIEKYLLAKTHNHASLQGLKS